jgi:hypothetical protein
MLIHKIITIIGKTALFQSQSPLQDLDHPVYTSLAIATVTLLQRKAVSFPSNPQPGKPNTYIYDPQWQGGTVIPPGTGF